jgi:O-antigen/teichoic acid export membrane protein
MIKQQIKRLTKNMLIYGVGQVLNRLIGFFLLPVFTSYLTPNDYGILSILGIITLFATLLFSLGFGGAMGPVYFESESDERKRGTIWTSFLILLLCSLAFTIIGVSFCPSISRFAFQHETYCYLIMLSLIGVCFDIIVMPFKFYLQFEEKAKPFVALSIISSFISLMASIIMVVILRRGATGMIEGQLFSLFITFLVFFLPARPVFHLDWNLGKELLRLGIPLIPSSLFIFILLQGNKYIMQWSKGLDAVGLYSVGFNVGMAMNMAVSAFQSAWYPYFMSFFHKKEEARILFGRIFTYYVFGFGALSLLFYIAARPVMMIMTHPSFHQAYKVVGLTSSAQFAYGAFLLLLPGIYFAKEVRYISVIQALTAIVATGVNFLLIPRYGLIAAGIALVSGYVVMVVLQQLWNSYRRRDYLAIVYEWNRVLLFSIVYAGCAILMIVKQHFSLPGEIITSGVACLVVLVSLFLLLNETERTQIWTTLSEIRALFCRTGPDEGGVKTGI